MRIQHDLRLAWRTLRRSPGLVVIAVVSLAFGIGANALVFSTSRALAFRPLPVPDARNVFFVQARESDGNSYPNYLDLRDRGSAVATLAAYRVVDAAVDAGAGARSAWGYLATGNYFEMLGVRPALGRFFTAAEDVGRGAAPYIVLSHGYWRGAFAADPSVVGRTVRVNGHPYTVVGIGPEGFHGTEVIFRADFWVPMTMAPRVEALAGWMDARTSGNIFVAGRLSPGVTREQAQQAMSTIANQLRREHAEANHDLRVTLTKPGLFGNVLRPAVEAFLGVTLVLALLVLLAAAANLANLLAARTIDRFRELAIRLSLGGTRAGIARQLTIETLLLCGLGAAAGFAIASVLLGTLSRWRPLVGIPIALDVSPDPTVLLFGAAVSIAAAVLAVGASVRRAWATDPAALLRGSTTAPRFRRWHLRDALLGVQVALCALLITTCFVSLHGLKATFATPLGFDPDGVTVASFDLSQVGYDRERGLAFRARLLEAMQSLPGVEGVTFASTLPMTTDSSSDKVVAERPRTPDDARGVDARAFIVPPGYFGVMKTPVIAGREYAPADARVVIVNETLARRLFGTVDAVGQALRAGDGGTIAVIGVVKDGKYGLPGEAQQPAVFWNAGQAYRPGTQLLVRSRLPQDDVVQMMRRAVASLDPTLPLTVPGSARDVISLAFLPATAAATILTALGIIALVLAVTGVYGLASYSVTARTREIGIRVAVGARAGQVLKSVLGRTSLVLVTFAGVGVALAAVASTLMANAIYQSSAIDPRFLAAGALAMIAVGLAAAWLPALRALRVDPARTLRQG